MSTLSVPKNSRELNPHAFNILLDMDSTITDLPRDWFRLNNETFDDDLTIDKVLSWNTSLYSKGGMGVFELLKTPGLFLNLMSLPHALEVVERLSKHYGIFIGSAVNSEQEQMEKFQWIQKHLSFIPPEHVKFTREKNKNNLFPNIHLLVDDAPHNVDAFKGYTLALPYPYNRECQPTRFVNDWLDIEQSIYDLLPVSIKF